MRITSGGPNTALPLNIAKAYGLKTAQQSLPRATPQAAPVQPGDGDATLAKIRPGDVYHPASAAQKLIAGTVNQPVNFDAAPAQPPPNALANAALQMYTRAADKMEAAIAVQVGRAIDVKG
jgi:hypothetical protein